MKKILLSLLLFPLLSTTCSHDDESLWNDLLVGDEIFHLRKVEFGQYDQIVCTGETDGMLILQLTLPDGTAITRHHMLQCPEGYHAELDAKLGTVKATLQGSDEHSGEYYAIDGLVEIERHEFKTSISLQDLQLARSLPIADTISISNGYLSFDLSLF